MVAMVAERSIYQGEELTFRYVAAVWPSQTDLWVWRIERIGMEI